MRQRDSGVWIKRALRQHSGRLPMFSSLSIWFPGAQPFPILRRRGRKVLRGRGRMHARPAHLQHVDSLLS